MVELVGGGGLLMVRFVVWEWHAVDAVAGFGFVHGDALGLGGAAIPLGDAVAAEEGEVH